MLELNFEKTDGLGTSFEERDGRGISVCTPKITILFQPSEQ